MLVKSILSPSKHTYTPTTSLPTYLSIFISNSRTVVVTGTTSKFSFPGTRLESNTCTTVEYSVDLPTYRVKALLLSDLVISEGSKALEGAHDVQRLACQLGHAWPDGAAIHHNGGPV